jgi:hypothetical protein
MINWEMPSDKVSINFTVGDSIWLERWGRMANENDGLNEQVKENLIKTMAVMDKIKEIFNRLPIEVHSSYRPTPYNIEIGGAKDSAHTHGLACDFHISNTNCDWVRKVLIPKLEELDIRMEHLDGAGWVHIDLYPVVNNRYFIP